jgi:hypothetical protein
MISATEQLEKDIAFCIDYLDLDDSQIGEMLRACERLGNISAEYFCEEFIFEDEPEAIGRYHDNDYLKIDWRLNS